VRPLYWRGSRGSTEDSSASLRRRAPAAFRLRADELQIWIAEEGCHSGNIGFDGVTDLRCVPLLTRLRQLAVGHALTKISTQVEPGECAADDVSPLFTGLECAAFGLVALPTNDNPQCVAERSIRLHCREPHPHSVPDLQVVRWLG